jgi:hypothetical protein
LVRRLFGFRFGGELMLWDDLTFAALVSEEKMVLLWTPEVTVVGRRRSVMVVRDRAEAFDF